MSQRPEHHVRRMVRQGRAFTKVHAHGLQQELHTIAAEAGGTPHEMMALSGHKTLGEVTRYTAAANRKKLAAEGMRKIERRAGNGNPV